jgi:hypothetical protein
LYINGIYFDKFYKIILYFYYKRIVFGRMLWYKPVDSYYYVYNLGIEMRFKDFCIVYDTIMANTPLLIFLSYVEKLNPYIFEITD